MSFEEEADDFSRLHKLFVFHLGIATGLAWMTATYAALYAPWVRNIRPLIDPAQIGRVESTWSFLFCFPLLLTAAWAVLFVGGDALRHFRTLRSQTAEFGVAAFAAFVVFYLSVDRAVTAILLGTS